jgi:hypothetical protein
MKIGSRQPGLRTSANTFGPFRARDVRPQRRLMGLARTNFQNADALMTSQTADFLRYSSSSTDRLAGPWSERERLLRSDAGGNLVEQAAQVCPEDADGADDDEGDESDHQSVLDGGGTTLGVLGPKPELDD